MISAFNINKVIFIFLILISLPCMATEQTKCDGYLKFNHSLKPHWTNNSSELEKILDSWNPDFFSNPNYHNDNNFRYIVKMSGRVAGELSLENALNFKIHIESKPVMSASLITHKAKSLYASLNPNQLDWGLILKVPPTLIACTILTEPDFIPGPQSMIGSRSELFDYYGIHNLETFIREYESNKHFNLMHNELKIFSKEGSLVRPNVLGLIVYVPTFKKERISIQVQNSKKIAKRLDLPLVILLDDKN